ncbi:short-chain dehydrogenase/reductase [Litorimonas cladophorae]|uniref:Short-chain dehydrogenase/reductase n=1 Tax=Litorimonas cladophorae TaxID=1220491 RepID=A0A918NF53_9PROT|nr:SDR family oxidoreductase [Litorimonas cladophorae]GGX62794.1 short-chain dehydrogenase/reductase [Litorimonas cladophorae]
MPNETNLNRRHLMIGAGVLAATYAATPSLAADDTSETPLDLTGTSILITGTSSGFGRLGAEHYARLGAKVFATMRNLPRPEATELKELANAEGLDITVIEIDVTQDRQVKSGVKKALKAAGGKLDVLINNAGMALSGPIEAQDMQATQLIFDTNVFGPQRMMRAVLPAMRAAGGGQIFNVTSQLGRVIIPGFGQYSPTKFALEAMSEQLAYEVQPHGIEVTIIQPGGYPTKIWENQAKPTAALKSRLSDDMLAAYPQFTAGMGKVGSGGGESDPMDIPRAIARTIAMPKGSRPLRVALHPVARPQEMINKVSAQTQIAVLGKSPYGPSIKAVLD